MKVAIIADIHANYAALRAFPEPFDELWVVGDLVNFGPTTPSDPLFGHLEQDADAWAAEVVSTRAQAVIVGHTHVPFLKRIGNSRLVNPGSLAGLRATSPQASYAV